MDFYGQMQMQGLDAYGGGAGGHGYDAYLGQSSGGSGSDKAAHAGATGLYDLGSQAALLSGHQGLYGAPPQGAGGVAGAPDTRAAAHAASAAHHHHHHAAAAAAGWGQYAAPQPGGGAAAAAAAQQWGHLLAGQHQQLSQGGGGGGHAAHSAAGGPQRAQPGLHGHYAPQPGAAGQGAHPGQQPQGQMYQQHFGGAGGSDGHGGWGR
mmetsp:Transcript_44665/g.74247  ORF Transcript_44665/g.74247 Transcript_44665/m.74247 type:complete len:207 (+) Transcript_44665:383-1003(+)